MKPAKICPFAHIPSPSDLKDSQTRHNAGPSRKEPISVLPSAARQRLSFRSLRTTSIAARPEACRILAIARVNRYQISTWSSDMAMAFHFD